MFDRVWHLIFEILDMPSWFPILRNITPMPLGPCLGRGLKYLLKVRCIILVYPNVTIFGACWKHYLVPDFFYKNERYLCLERHSFTKLSQNRLVTYWFTYSDIWLDSWLHVTASYGTLLDIMAFFGFHT